MLGEGRDQREGNIPFLSDVVENFSERFRRFHRSEAAVERVRVGKQGRPEGGQPGPRQRETGDERGEQFPRETPIQVPDPEVQSKNETTDKGRTQWRRGVHCVVNKKKIETRT